MPTKSRRWRVWAIPSRQRWLPQKDLLAGAKVASATNEVKAQPTIRLNRQTPCPTFVSDRTTLGRPSRGGGSPPCLGGGGFRLTRGMLGGFFTRNARFAFGNGDDPAS